MQEDPVLHALSPSLVWENGKEESREGVKEQPCKKSFLRDCDSAVFILLHTVALAMSSSSNLPLHAYFNQLNLIASECDVTDKCPSEANFGRPPTSDKTGGISKCY